MANVDVEIGARRYSIACRDGEQEHLRSVAALVDKRSGDAAQALGNLSESRLLLYTSLLLADDLKSGTPAPPPAPEPDPLVAQALERLAERVEALAESLEQRA